MVNLEFSHNLELKLKNLLCEQGVFSNERNVLFFLVGVRKLLEAKKTRDLYKYTKFFTDWSLHPKKTKLLPDIENHLKILRKCPDSLLNSNEHYVALKELFQMTPVRAELKTMLPKLNLDDFTTNNITWFNFRNNWIGLLDNQPIIIDNSHHSELEQITFSQELHNIEIVYGKRSFSFSDGNY